MNLPFIKFDREPFTIPDGIASANVAVKQFTVKNQLGGYKSIQAEEKGVAIVMILNNEQCAHLAQLLMAPSLPGSEQ